MDSFYITAQGVTIVCHERDNVLEWVQFILDKGWAPKIEKKTT